MDTLVSQASRAAVSTEVSAAWAAISNSSKVRAVAWVVDRVGTVGTAPAGSARLMEPGTDHAAAGVPTMGRTRAEGREEEEGTLRQSGGLLSGIVGVPDCTMNSRLSSAGRTRVTWG